MQVQRTDTFIRPDATRVLFRAFEPHTTERAVKVIARVLALSDDEVDHELREVLRDFEDRHLRLEEFFLRRFEQNRRHLLTDRPLSRWRRLLIGAYFTQEYSLESSALFNPSMVWHPDQSGVPAGSRRFILSLRATGEGHISSITFRSGVVDADGRIAMDPVSRFVTTPDVRPDPRYDKTLFGRKLLELGLTGSFESEVLRRLDDSFTFSELEREVRAARRTERLKGRNSDPEAEGMLSLGLSNYEIEYRSDQKLSERIVFPSTPAEVKGIEDARFVEFTDDDGLRTYYATYTAYDGRVFIPQLVETKDFLRFRVRTLNGPEVENKGLALFPRKIGGKYAVLSRQDNENIYLMFSDNIDFWYSKEVLLKPTYPWEFVQLGNCGSPIETDAGWVVLTHGVGPMRKYAIGAILLDREDPSRVIGRLRKPLITPNGNEREGYVPNVVYSCGGQVHAGRLIIPYAMADYASTFATVDLGELLHALRESHTP